MNLPLTFMPTNSIVHNPTISLLVKVNNRHVVASEKLIERAGEKRLRVLSGLGLNKPDAAPETVRQISADMDLPSPACRSARLVLP